MPCAGRASRSRACPTVLRWPSHSPNASPAGRLRSLFALAKTRLDRAARWVFESARLNNSRASAINQRSFTHRVLLFLPSRSGHSRTAPLRGCSIALSDTVSSRFVLLVGGKPTLALIRRAGAPSWVLRDAPGDKCHGGRCARGNVVLAGGGSVPAAAVDLDQQRAQHGVDHQVLAHRSAVADGAAQQQRRQRQTAARQALGLSSFELDRDLGGLVA